jgi:hypothetical protein
MNIMMIVAAVSSTCASVRDWFDNDIDEDGDGMSDEVERRGGEKWLLAVQTNFSRGLLRFSVFALAPIHQRNLRAETTETMFEHSQRPF